MHGKLGWAVWLLAVLLAELLGNSDSEAVTPEYYCLEDYKPIGNVIRRVSLPLQDRQATSGHIARQCSAACSAEPTCTAFTATGSYSPLGVGCQLLANSSAAIPAALQLPPGSQWPSVLESVTAGDRLTLRSTGWLCLRGANLWDRFGEATHAVIHTGSVESGNVGHDYHCVYGSDVAGSNLQQYTTPIHSPQDCDDRCASSVGCVVWTFAAAQNGSGQAPFNCFLKADPFKGENGWTGKPKPDIWIPDSQVDCFTDLQDWRELGLTLSPAIKTVNWNNTYYTLYPERVTFNEARRACQTIPHGQLAILDTRMEIDTAYRELLSTLSPETGVTSAWAGVMGNNTHYNPAAQNQTGLGQKGMSLGQIGQLHPQPVRDRTASGPETTLHWLNGEAVDPNQLRRLTQHDVWTVHDVIWNQQYVPDSSQYVCGRVLVQAPPTASSGPVEPSAVLPGLWYFDCDKLAPFICQSPQAPNEPMTGRSIVIDGNTASAPAAASPNWRMAVAVVVPVVALLLALWQLSRLYRRQVSRLPELIRQQRKRALGQPSWGRMSVVVTDIQGFTNLMRDAPDQMAQALLLHNQVMKHACYDNIGYVLEQEGDSFTLAFHEPTDAVAFTLQVQQALLEQPWPPDINYQDEWDASTQQQQQQAATGNRHSSDRGSTPSPAPDSSPRGRGRASLSSLFGFAFSSRSDSQTAAVADRHSSEVNGWLSDPNLPFAAPSASALSYTWSPRAAAGAAPSVAGFSRRRAAWLQQLQRQHRGNESAVSVFQGVRVRMGVASGYVGKGQEVKSSALYKTAQDVSNAANGGQVLMDEPTFTAVKEELWRLGLVTSTGLNYDMLYNASSSGTRSRRSSIGSSSSRDDATTASSAARLLECWNGRRSSVSSGSSTRVEHALALDMGAYQIDSSQRHTARAQPGSSSSSWPLWTSEAGADLVQQYQQYLQQQLLVDQQSDVSDRSDIVTTGGTTGRSVSGGDIEAGFHTPHGSATAGSQSLAVAPQLLMSQQQQRQQHVDPGQQRHDWSVHDGSERLGGVWRAVFGGVLGFRGVSRKRRRSSSGDVEDLGGVITDSADGFPATWGGKYVAGPSCIRLYQVIAPSLIGRAALFGSDLALPKHWKQLDAPYFAAPGLSSSSGGSSSSALASPPAAAPRPSTDRVAQHEPPSPEANAPSPSPATAASSATGCPQAVVDEHLVQQGSVQQLLADDAASTGSSSSTDHNHHIRQEGLTPDRQAPADGAAAVEHSDRYGRSGSTAVVSINSAVSPFAAAAAAARAAAAANSAAAAELSDQDAATAGKLEDNWQQQQQQPSLKPPGSSVVSNSALLRGMSLRADFALPSLVNLGSAAGAGGGVSSVDGMRVSAVRPQYPTVTIVFAMVEGASHLLRCPTLARSTHVLIQRLLLSSLTAFPGSYLIRAQEGDLKYMAAFTTPAAAVEWCMTVQEAALYAPYPPEVLGLDCCGVQLDSAGRLVFRGPRFKMGLSEGVPKCILPDYLGRADYHGPFVNQAARFADAAAHGGQIVTDSQLADQVISYWRMMDNIQRANSKCPTVRRQLQQVALQPQPQQQLLPPSPHCLVKSVSVDTGLMRDNNVTAAHLNKQQQQQQQQQQEPANNQPYQPPTPPAVPAAAPGVATPDRIPVSVEVSWLGSFLYKGNPMPLDMVCFSPSVLAGRSYPSSSPGGKGVRVAQRVGERDAVTVSLPAVVDCVQ